MKRWLAALASVLASACGSPEVLQTALHGDLAQLKREIASSQRAGRLTERRVEELAWAVAGREIQSARGAMAVRRVTQARPCARPLGRVLSERARREDDAGAEAALVLFEIGQYDGPPPVGRYAESSSGAWRALAARAALAPEYAEMRRGFYLDPDERVRRAALMAAVLAPNPDDASALLEAARLDPDPVSRASATRAAGALGGSRVVLALADHWALADEETRMTVIDAWAAPRAYSAGGREQIIRIAETETAFEALAAAETLSRQSREDAKLGAARLARIIEQGTTEERRVALRVAPLSDPAVRQAVVAAVGARDRGVRVMALATLLADPREAARARRELRRMAQGRDSVAWQAQAALSAAGDPSVLALLRQELAAPRSYRRQLAALGLLRLGDYPQVATALADDDPAVRMEVSCAVLARSE